ncbi:hypothetical protein DYU05_14155 [Mucilaginibacter terrenus]|uniref:T9SS type B sorting domain-containing protein n=2 Tax=Mucilaginibacter terrenus TaxID=2482727 RepID=A0A3E2NQK9_9SPHI|nr:hypothetical protein DYU05_14155 [Mucilaginibacter terrenus]
MKGPVGTIVNINGVNFGSAPVVYFGATRAEVLSANNSALSVEVPAGATFQPLSVLNTASHLTGYSKYPYHVTFSSTGKITALNFNGRLDIQSGEGPTSLGTADLDGDGKVDLVVANGLSNTISIYRNISVMGTINANSFAPKFDIPTGFLPNNLDIADLDGDGKLDIVVANYVSNTLSIFKNQAVANVLSAASFKQRVDIPTAIYPYVIKMGDLDLDGKPDITIAHSYVGVALSIIKNSSSYDNIAAAGFSTTSELASGNGYYSVAVADLNNNNKPDIILTDVLKNNLSIFDNIGSNNWGLDLFNSPKVFNTQPTPLVVNTGDMDGDGRTDLITSNFGDNLGPNPKSSFFLGILLNKDAEGGISANSFGPVQNFETGRIPQGSAVGDIDGDGKLDAITTNYDESTISILHNTSTVGSLSFDPRVDLPVGINPQSVKIVDLDGDGKADIVTTNNLSNTISIYRNNAEEKLTLDFPLLKSVVYGAADFDPGAVTNGQQSAIIYTIDNPAVADITSDKKVRILSVGQVTITASLPLDPLIATPKPIKQILVVMPAPLLIKVNNSSRPYGIENPDFSFSYKGFVNNETADVIDTRNMSVSTTANKQSLPGRYPLTVSGEALSPNYTFSYQNGDLIINKIKQTINFDLPPSATVNEKKIEINATASSGLPVAVISQADGVVSVSGNTANIFQVGKALLIATQAGNDIYEPVSEAKEILILPAEVIISSNTFTPNNDGINDYWNLEGLEFDYKSTVGVYNRLGKVVFQSRGYAKPFDGSYNGKKLPAGVYYYVITFTDGRKPLSGNVTIIY